jgi:hypothetical protein
MDKKEPPKDAEPPKCKPHAMKMSFCVMHQNIKNCPASKWNNSEECEAAKAKLASDECKHQKKEDKKEDTPQA